jgi:hypothetical protein
MDDANAPNADARAVTPGLMEAMGMRLVEGRFFTEADQPGRVPAIVVDNMLAARMWPGRSALGQHLGVDPGSNGTSDGQHDGRRRGEARSAAQPRRRSHRADFLSRALLECVAARDGGEPDGRAPRRVVCVFRDERCPSTADRPNSVAAPSV